MATLLSTSNGNWTSSSTWKTADSTSLLDNVSNAASTSVSAQNSSSFTTGAITIEGIALQIRDRSSSLGGTLTVSLYNVSSTIDVTGTSVTVNVNDLPDTYNITNNRGMGWVYFKFSSPVTLLAATNYAVRVVTSVNASVNIYASTGTNWSRALVTSTTAAPAASDIMIISGVHTGQGTNSTTTVTMDNTTATAFGNVYVGVKGTLTYGTSTSTNYNLRLTGNLFITSEGTFNMGTSLSLIPSSSTATLEFNVSSSGQYGIFLSGGTFNAYGQPKTQYVRLSADAAVSATTLTLSSTPTSWNNGDTIGITSTTITPTQAEVRTLSANVTGTSATVSSGLTNAHGGNSTTLVQAHVVNLTRNVIIKSVSATLTSHMQITGTNTSANISDVLFLMMGSTTATTPAIGIATSGSSRNLNFTMTNSVMYQSTILASSLGFNVSRNGLTSPISYTFTNNVVWGTGGNGFSNVSSSAFVTKNTNGTLFIRNTGVSYSDITASADNIVVSNSSATGALTLAISGNSTPHATGVVNFLSSVESYGHSGNGLFFNCTAFALTTLPLYLQIDSALIWRCGLNGVIFQPLDFPSPFSILKITNARIFGTTNTSISVSTGGISNGTVIFDDCTFWSGTTTTTINAISSASQVGASLAESLMFRDCIFGKDHLNNTSSFTTSILPLGNLRSCLNVVILNPTTTGTLVSRSSAQSNCSGYLPGILVQNLNGISGDDYIYNNTGTITKDTTIFKTSSPSVRLTPALQAVTKVSSSTVRVPIKNGQSCTISVWVRKSQLSDGVDYNGSSPNLIWRPNLAASNLDNTIVGTGSVANGTWEKLNYTTPTISYDTTLEFVVTCDGSAGWLNIDDWDVDLSNDSRGDFISSGSIGNYVEPSFSPTVTQNGVSYTFIN